MPKHVILFLAANPHGTSRLELGEECAQIQRELKMSSHRDDFDFQSRWAVSIDDLMRHLMELEPTVIHFSGHGGGSAGILFQGENRTPQPVSARALAMMVASATCEPRVVVLNACYSTAQADALRANVDCVVGMDGAIGDYAARSFAVRFYGALGNRRSIGNAVAQGVAALAAKQLSDEVLPCCVTRDGLDAQEVFLHHSSRRTEPVRRNTARGNRVLYAWLHLSDIHFGDGDAFHRAHKRTVLDGMRGDIREVLHQNGLQPQAIFVTGNVAFSGGADICRSDREVLEYDLALTWLHSLAHDLGIRHDAIFAVPGTHDVDRTADMNAMVGDLVARLRKGVHSLDVALSVPAERTLITKRLEKYLEFERRLSSHYRDNEAVPQLYWQRCVGLSGGIRLRIAGLNTALLATGENDRGKLAMGMLQIAETLTDIRDNEVVIVLSHHPMTGGWLVDEKDLAPFLLNRAHIHLAGHVHVTGAEKRRRVISCGHIRIGASAAHAKRSLPLVPTGYGYSVGCMVVSMSGQVALRVWPRRWSNRSASFVSDAENLGPDQVFVEYAVSMRKRRSSVLERAHLKLVVIHGERKGTEVELFPGTYLLGRSRHAVLDLPHDGRTSREHASLFVTSTKVLIQDESQHGTWVDGIRLAKFEPVALEVNATIQIGGSLLCMIEAHERDSAPPT